MFFKAIKQNLRIKTFVGTSPNAVHIQIWTALIAILLLKYLKMRSRGSS
jgi:IS4 transposase